jgi:hypothetical protein
VEDSERCYRSEADRRDAKRAAQLALRVLEEWGRLDIFSNDAALAVLGSIGEPPTESAR